MWGKSTHVFVEGDIGDRDLVRCLFDCARAYCAGLGISGKASFHFLRISTDEAYSSLGPPGKFTETTPYTPNSPYAASKAAADYLVRAWHHTYGLSVLTTNCSNNYGPYQFPEKLISVMILKALRGKRLPVYGDGSNVEGLALRCGPLSGYLASLRGRASRRGLQRGERAQSTGRHHPL